jgi:hypothetical protein
MALLMPLALPVIAVNADLMTFVALTAAICIALAFDEAGTSDVAEPKPRRFRVDKPR